MSARRHLIPWRTFGISDRIIMKICYFTATGNSLYAAKRIRGDLLSIPKLMREKAVEISDDAVGNVCPVYCGEMPGMVRSFLEKAVI